MPSPAHDAPLQGRRVWVTRPAHQAQELVRQLEQAGAQVQLIPLLHIEPVPYDPARPRLTDLGQYQFILFVSANAASAAAPHVEAAGGLPAETRLGVVGKGTAQAVAHTYGRQPELVPPARADSEGLLALESLQRVSNQAVLIIRGDRGRETLAETLRERGARVDYAGVYHRHLADVDLDKAPRPRPDIILITSSEALRHLAALAADQRQPWVFDTALIVVHERIRQLARDLGFRGHIQLSQGAGDATVVETLKAWVQYTGSGSKEDRP